jgi:glycolate oxidase
MTESTAPSPGIARLLREVEVATDDPVARAAARVDRSGYPSRSMPDAVVLARSTDDVARALRIADEEGLAVVPRGAGTGLAGGSVARAGEVVVDVSRLDRILSIDADEQLAVVQPGVLNHEVDAAAAPLGLFYAPDPGSTMICSIGGNVATNAGGMRCEKYGVTRESVLALEVVLADGTVLRTGHRTIKGVAGYDLTALLVGSEGTLGIVTEITLRLRPRPVATATLAAWFADAATAARAVAAIVAARVQPAMLELMDAGSLAAVDAAYGTTLARGDGALLIVQTDGFAAAAEADVVVEAIRPLALECRLAEGAEAATLVQARRDVIPAVERLGRLAICDVGVPRTRLAEAVAGIEEISRARGVPILTIAHAGDGNLHPLVHLKDGEDLTTGAPYAALADMFHLAHGLGGTLTGEHGVGLVKREWLAEEVGPDARRLYAGIKAAFDPRGILNPGKAI